ncbi:MAG: hypothetical protein QOI35_3261 [Cryptosporangiaceae bacterium]|nr:hypothetical protein [Cryptosporangiaceae bacterium]
MTARRWIEPTALSLTGAWICGVVVLSQSVAWLVQQTLLVDELGWPRFGDPLVCLGGGVAIGVVVGPAALAIRHPVLRSVARCWAVAALALVVLGVARALPLPWSPVALLVVAGLLLLAFALLRVRVAGGGLLGGTAAGLAILLPWWFAGALGSWWETLAALAAAAALGLFTAALFARFLWRPLAGAPRWMRILLGGLAAAVALVPIAAGAGPAGIQLLLLAVLPPAGFAAAAIADRPSSAGPGLLVALAAAGPLAFVDPEQLTLILGLHDVDYWALIAALLSALAGLFSLGLVWLGGRRVLAGAAALLAVTTGTVWISLGHPGLYGDRIFVILKSQPGLGNLPTGIAARRAEVYHRLVAEADRTQRPIRAQLRSWHVPYTPYYLVNAIELPDDPVLRGWLATRPEVDRVLHSPRLRPIPAPEPPMRGSLPAPVRPWNLEAIRVPEARSALGVDGSGIVIGESDSGVDGTHPALRGSYGGRWLDPWNHTRTPTDVGGHGTHTTAIAMSVAPGARWIGCVNLARNLGNPGAYVTCLQFMLAPYPQSGDPLRDGDPAHAADVLNNSWGCPDLEGCDRGTLLPAIRSLRAAGIFAVVSAGNSGPRCGSIEDPPAIYPEVLSVGAVDRANRIAEFSSRGSAGPDVLAPGVDVVSALPGGGYGPLDGTSMAAPHVTGVVALMWQANPRLAGDVARTESILRDTARPIPSSCGHAAGLVDALAAVTAARAAR